MDKVLWIQELFTNVLKFFGSGPKSDDYLFPSYVGMAGILTKLFSPFELQKFRYVNREKEKGD